MTRRRSSVGSAIRTETGKGVALEAEKASSIVWMLPMAEPKEKSDTSSSMFKTMVKVGAGNEVSAG